jgi:hypothetical protein
MEGPSRLGRKAMEPENRRFRGIARLRHVIWDKVEKLWLTSPM